MPDETEPDPRMYMIVQHLFTCDLLLEQLMNRELEKDGLTVKQFQLLWTIGNFETPPSIKEAAAEMCTSHQNVKQMGLLLQKKGFLRMEKDPSDRRTSRLHLTEANEFYWKRRAPDHDIAMKKIFEGISDGDLTILERKLCYLRKVFAKGLKKQRME
jgi:DNA-binding MarR family transcriptional regulator